MLDEEGGLREAVYTSCRSPSEPPACLCPPDLSVKSIRPSGLQTPSGISSGLCVVQASWGVPGVVAWEVHQRKYVGTPREKGIDIQSLGEGI